MIFSIAPRSTSNCFGAVFPERVFECLCSSENLRFEVALGRPSHKIFSEEKASQYPSERADRARGRILAVGNVIVFGRILGGKLITMTEPELDQVGLFLIIIKCS